MNIWRIIIIFSILGLLSVGLFCKTSWDLKIIALLYTAANTLIYKELIFG